MKKIYLLGCSLLAAAALIGCAAPMETAGQTNFSLRYAHAPGHVSRRIGASGYMHSYRNRLYFTDYDQWYASALDDPSAYSVTGFVYSREEKTSRMGVSPVLNIVADKMYCYFRSDGTVRTFDLRTGELENFITEEYWSMRYYEGYYYYLDHDRKLKRVIPISN
jgi:hypothetical protein